MPWPTSLARLLIALTLAVAAFALASAGAQAHAGHDHATHPGTPAVHQQHVGTPASQFAPVTGAGKLIDAGAKVPNVSSLNTHHQETSAACPSGCCHSGGACCCAAWISPLLTLLPPRAGRLTVELTVAGGAGIWPDALPEPPKSHV